MPIEPSTRGKLHRHFQNGGLTEVLKWTVHSLHQRTFGKLRARCAPKIESVLQEPSVQDRFTKIYETNYWGSSESRSGSGSDLAYASTFAQELGVFLDSNKIRTLFDAPCGDYNWMRTVVRPADFKYIGGDIVQPLISDLKARFEGDGTSFRVFNIIRDTFPRADVWLCRECLFHLSSSDVKAALINFSKSDIELALITCNFNIKANVDIETGAWRALDLRLDPIGLPEPMQILSEAGSNEHQRFVGLWHRSAIAEAARRWAD